MNCIVEFFFHDGLWKIFFNVVNIFYSNIIILYYIQFHGICFPQFRFYPTNNDYIVLNFAVSNLLGIESISSIPCYKSQVRYCRLFHELYTCIEQDILKNVFNVELNMIY